jgi:septal ring factor EnvC (AmiA/AmiB activator)
MSRIVVVGAILAALTACAGRDDAAIQRTVTAQAQGQAEHKTADLSVLNAQLKIQIEELTGQLKAAREQIARTEQERKEMRDELLRMKIAQEETQRARERERKIPPVDTARRDTERAAPPPHTGATPADPELKRRLRDLVHELEDLLQKP